MNTEVWHPNARHNFILLTHLQPNFNLDFGSLDNPDVLENFDFDSFLHTEGDGGGFGFEPMLSLNPDGVEAGE